MVCSFSGKGCWHEWLSDCQHTGYGHGSFYILNASYAEVARFDAAGYPGRALSILLSVTRPGLTKAKVGDLHELLITPEDHAIVLVYTPKQVDLTEVGGASDGWILDNIIQEIDIETNVCIGCYVGHSRF